MPRDGNLKGVLRLLLSRRWLLRHVLLLLAIGAFLALGRWQWSRADAGNGRSFGYAFEWPLFAAFAIFWWGRTLHMERHPESQRPAEAPVTGRPWVDQHPAEEEPDEELDTYNRYLAWLHEQDQRPTR